MLPLNQPLNFFPWWRSKLADQAAPDAQDPARLGSTVNLSLNDTRGGSASAPLRYTLMSAADTAGLKPGAVLRTAPQPFARDAEVTKFVHIDLVEPDLPWRYTPRPQQGGLLRPWLVLLVGPADELVLEGSFLKSASKSVLAAHPLGQSHLWAHVQDDQNRQIGRILSPQLLLPQREYSAALVPAFNGQGQDLWDAQGNLAGVLTAYFSWRFWTAEAGDFLTLSAALVVRAAGNLGRARLHYVRDVTGVNRVLMARGAITSLKRELEQLDPDALSDAELLEVLLDQRPGLAGPEGAPEEPDPALLTTPEKLQRVKDLRQAALNARDETRADLKQLVVDIPDDGEPARQIISLPHYGRPWLPEPQSFAAGWPFTVNDDPRGRSAAGLGLWMGIEGQEELMGAAVKQAGALREAVFRFNHLVMGLFASGSLWERRLPNDANLRLRVLGPMLGRIPAGNGGMVLDGVTPANSRLPRGLFSSAAQRLLRGGSAHTRHVQGGMNAGAAMDLINTTPADLEGARAPAGLPHIDHFADEPYERRLGLEDDLLRQILEKWDGIVREWVTIFEDNAPQMGEVEVEGMLDDLAFHLFDEFRDLLGSMIGEFNLPCDAIEILQDLERELNPSPHEEMKLVISEEEARREFRAWFFREMRRCLARRFCRENVHDANRQLCMDAFENLYPEPVLDPKPVALGVLAARISDLIDPRSPKAPARRRVTATIQGLDLSRMVPPEFPIGLDFPTWSLLNTYDKEWLLPGAGTLPKDSLVALQTNPTFIDSYMLGINTQFMNEMRWRDLAVARDSTPLRMFWGYVDYASKQRKADIQPFSEWVKAPEKDLGDLSHQTIKPGDVTGKLDLVVLFHTDLFRRYPATLVYLVKPGPGDDLDTLLKQPPVLEHTPADRPNRVYFGPIFFADMQPDLRFFIFDVDPSDLDQYWLVLDEPPIQLRFRSDKASNNASSATFARSVLDQPVRVAINGAEMEKLGNH